MKLGKCPICNDESTSDEWSYGSGGTSYTYVECIPQIEGDYSICPKCQAEVFDDSIDWSEVEYDKR